MNDKPANADSALREMASLWVRSQAIVSAYITANVIDLHHAEDLIQETAKGVAEGFSNYDNSRPFTPWVLAIARNQILKYYRTRSRDRMVLSENALTTIGGALERIEHEAEDRRQALRLCLERIRGRSRKLLEMRYESDMKAKDIAAQLGITPSTVSVMLFRIRAILEKCIRLQLTREAN